MIRRTVSIVLLAAALGAAVPSHAGGYLQRDEVVGLVAAPIVLLSLGDHLSDAGARRPPRWTEPPAFDRWFTETFAPAPQTGPRTFMESDVAAGVNTAAAGLAIGIIDARWSPRESGRDIGQGQLLYWSGLLTMKGIQDAVKGQVARQRPLPRLAPEVAARRTEFDPGRDQRSFWSGHASSAFYASAFLNLRIREALRRELSPDDYRSWRWAPSTLLFSWSAWIAWTRVESYNHYLSDVLVGSAVGWAFAELFHSLDDRAAPENGAAKARPLIGFSVGF